MTRIAIAALIALSATAASADMGSFLPSLTFPTAQPDPIVSTQGCLPQQTCPVTQEASQ